MYEDAICYIFGNDITWVLNWFEILEHTSLLLQVFNVFMQVLCCVATRFN
jgi:hypothetical protein